MSKKLTNPKLSLKLLTVLYRSSVALQRHACRQIQRSQLGPTDFAILEVLLHKGSLPISLIGSKILLTNGSMTTAVDRLEERALVERICQSGDRRTKLVALTAKGRALIEPVVAELEAVMERASNGLTCQEKVQFIELAKKLGKFAQFLE
jgi:MarR family 2-MHQ and catechol resistance regulon transcriptional repressor